MKYLFAVAILSAASVSFPSDAQNYVGGGRYLCTDGSAACALVKQNNRAITKSEREERSRSSYRNDNPTFEPRKSRFYSTPSEPKREERKRDAKR